MNDKFDHSTKQEFYDYYANESLSDTTIQRFKTIKEVIVKLLNNKSSYEVADIGCGAGTNSMIWAEAGHTIHSLDVNEPLVELGRNRSKKEGYDIDFRVGTATNLPWDDCSMDICLAPELLEHVDDWESCLDEFCRILKPGGLLYLSTSNKLCPLQQEFTLPLYSWYPGFIKRYCEKLAVTTHPEIVNHAKYPAVNWFSFYQLKKKLADKQLQSMDRFDLIDTSSKKWIVKQVISVIKSIPLLRFMGHVATPYTIVIAIKNI